MTWNYRILETEEDGCIFQAIHEVYYNGDGDPSGYAEAASEVQTTIRDDEGSTGDTIQGLFLLMAGAFSKPVLTVKDFPSTFESDPIMRAIDLG